MTPIETVSFETALVAAKQGKSIARIAFRDTCFIVAKYPTDESQNTLPYLQMWKNLKVKDADGDDMYDIFPVDLSCESIFAEDWYIVKDSE